MRTAQEMQAAVIGKAAEDVDFRAQLLSDPKGAIEQELGISMHEESSTNAHLVLPPASKLKAADLQAVAGGLGGTGVTQPDSDWNL